MPNFKVLPHNHYPLQYYLSKLHPEATEYNLQCQNLLNLPVRYFFLTRLLNSAGTSTGPSQSGYVLINVTVLYHRIATSTGHSP
jgi:hypothetical protein